VSIHCLHDFAGTTRSAIVIADRLIASSCLARFTRLPFGLVPGGETATMLVKKVAALNCIIFVGLIQMLFGYWKPGKDPLNSHFKSK